MKKIMLQTMLLICMCMASCSDIEDNTPILSPDQEQEEPVTSNRPQDYEGLINKTYSVSANYGGKSNVRAPCVHFKFPPLFLSLQTTLVLTFKITLISISMPGL